MRSVPIGLPLVAAAFLAGCATTPGGQRLAERDPLESWNRNVWAFNRGVDNALLKPGAQTYKAVTPTAARRGVRNVLNNADEPLSFINALLQGKVGRAFHTLGRFVVNTTIGVGGLADHASSMGLEEKPEDFGQTLATWGVNAGPYVMLPLLGPSTLRDAVGFGVEVAGDPVGLAVKEYSGLSSTQRLAIPAMEAIDLRAQLIELGADNFLETSLDPYAAARSAYLQRRQALILDQDGAATSGSEGVNPDDFDFAPENGASAPAGAPGVDPADFDVAPATEGVPPAQSPPAPPASSEDGQAENPAKIDAQQ